MLCDTGVDDSNGSDYTCTTSVAQSLTRPDDSVITIPPARPVTWHWSGSARESHAMTTTGQGIPAVSLPESSMTQPTAETPLATPRQAILVIHGIGRQHRFQTLDRFVNGLRAVTPWATVTHVRHPPTEPFDHFVRLRGKRALDVFELYWVPRTVEKTSFAAVARWLYATGFA